MLKKELLLQVRKISHAGFADCKKAIEATDDLESALKWLKEQGVVKGNKFTLRTADEGSTWAKHNSEGIAIIELNSETDFTGSSEKFQTLAITITDHLLSTKITNLQELKNSKIQEYSVEELTLQLSALTGEKISLSKALYLPIQSSQSGFAYRHSNGKISSAIILDKKVNVEDLKGLALHVAANQPLCLDGDMPQEWFQQEQMMIAKETTEGGKFANKIMENKLNKVLSQISLVRQKYLMNNSISVSTFLETLGAKVIKFHYMELGVK